MKHLQVYVDQTPPSSNAQGAVGGGGHGAVRARTKAEWEGIFQAMLMHGKLPRRLKFVRVKPYLEFKRKGKAPDMDNFYFPISKPLGDCLQKGGWLKDDDPSHYQCERPEIEMGVSTLPPMAKGRLILEIDYDDGTPTLPPDPAAHAGGADATGGRELAGGDEGQGAGDDAHAVAALEEGTR